MAAAASVNKSPAEMPPINMKIQSLLQPSSKRKVLLSATDAFPWIRASCMKLDVSFEAIFRATWICHKLEASGFHTGHFLQALAAVIFLSCKCSDQMRPPRDVLNCLHAVHQGDGSCIPLGSTYRTLKHGLIAREALVLRCLHFDAGMNEVAPHTYALRTLQQLGVQSAHAQTVISALNDITPHTVGLSAVSVGPAACIVVLGSLHLASHTETAATARSSPAVTSKSCTPVKPTSIASAWPESFSAEALWAAAIGSGATSDGIEAAVLQVSQHLLQLWKTKTRQGNSHANLTAALESICLSLGSAAASRAGENQALG